MSFVIYTGVILVIISALYVVSFVISWAWTERTIEKLSSYECGLEPFAHRDIQFDILFYIVGLLFLLFDLEIIFLFPLACVYMTMESYVSMVVAMVFFIILTIGLCYEWFLGVLHFGQND